MTVEGRSPLYCHRSLGTLLDINPLRDIEIDFEIASKELALASIPIGFRLFQNLNQPLSIHRVQQVQVGFQVILGARKPHLYPVIAHRAPTTSSTRAFQAAKFDPPSSVVVDAVDNTVDTTAV